MSTPSRLEQLFSTSSLEEFLSTFWPGTPAVVHGPLERLGALSSHPELSDVGRVLEVFKEPVMVLLPDERDEHSAIKVDAQAALAHYQAGLALCCESVDRFIPLVSEWLSTIRLELGLPAATFARALVYAGRVGAGNSPHYDANANIVVQLRGTKRWTLAPNTHVVDPTDRWAMTMGFLPPELTGSDASMPRQMPAGAKVIDLLPGSVLFVPRGYWHATEVASEDTLSLNFTFSQPSWAEVVTAALLNRLHRTPVFRRLADGLESPLPTRQRAAEEQLARMLELFQKEVQGMGGDDVLAELFPERTLEPAKDLPKDSR